MTELPTKKLQWKWVWISLGMYVVFYFLPLSLLPGGWLSGRTVTTTSAMVISSWMFAGIVVISGLAGYLSEEVTIREPAIAALLLMILWLAAEQVSLNDAMHLSGATIAMIALVLALMGLLALGGAAIGERIQRAGKKQDEGKLPQE